MRPRKTGKVRSPRMIVIALMRCGYLPTPRKYDLDEDAENEPR